MEEPVTPRPSASLILLRDGNEGPEVLLVQRNPQQRFMGGAWVFPGGATDPEDADERATAIRETAEEASVTLAPDAELGRWSRWITPAQGRAMRFDTHFFVARAPDDAQPQVDGSECIDWRWSTPAAALAASRTGDFQLRFPTVKHLEQLAAYATVDAVLAAARGRRVQPIEPRLLTEGGVARVLLPGEPGYDEA